MEIDYILIKFFFHNKRDFFNDENLKLNEIHANFWLKSNNYANENETFVLCPAA